MRGARIYHVNRLPKFRLQNWHPCLHFVSLEVPRYMLLAYSICGMNNIDRLVVTYVLGHTSQDAITLDGTRALQTLPLEVHLIAVELFHM